MKNLLIIICLLATNMSYGQLRRARERDSTLQSAPPVYNPYQFPNYYQNNSMFVNNSMQTNPPPNRKAGQYTGNADYVDPTRNTPSTYNNSSGGTTIRSGTNTNNVIK